MTKLEERMHALEDALAIVQATESKNPHPLLSQPFSLDEDDDDLLEEEEEEDTKTIIGTSGLADAFGALHMENNNGASQRFFGPSGGSEVRPYLDSVQSLIRTYELVCRVYCW